MFLISTGMRKEREEILGMHKIPEGEEHYISEYTDRDRSLCKRSTRFVSCACQPFRTLTIHYAIPALTFVCCISNPASCSGIGRTCNQATSVRPMAAHLEDVSTDALIREIQRRIECATKPEKHVVLIGELRMILVLHP